MASTSPFFSSSTALREAILLRGHHTARWATRPSGAGIPRWLREGARVTVPPLVPVPFPWRKWPRRRIWGSTWGRRQGGIWRRGGVELQLGFRVPCIYLVQPLRSTIGSILNDQDRSVG